MKKIFILFLTLINAMPIWAKHAHPEKYYQIQWCNAHKGIIEYKLKDNTRVDCLTYKYAVEVDFAKKYHECLGQAQHYSARTGKQGACLLIIEEFKDYKYVKNLRKTIYKKKLDIRSFVIESEEIKSFRNSLEE